MNSKEIDEFYKQKNIEDATTIQHLPDRQVFNIDVGNLSPEEAQQAIAMIQKRLKEKEIK